MNKSNVHQKILYLDESAYRPINFSLTKNLFNFDIFYDFLISQNIALKVGSACIKKFIGYSFIFYLFCANL